MKTYSDKEVAEVVESMNEDQKSYYQFVLRQIELGTDFAKWFKAFKTMNQDQRNVFNQKVNEALTRKEKRDKDA